MHGSYHINIYLKHGPVLIHVCSVRLSGLNPQGLASTKVQGEQDSSGGSSRGTPVEGCGRPYVQDIGQHSRNLGVFMSDITGVSATWLLCKHYCKTLPREMDSSCNVLITVGHPVLPRCVDQAQGHMLLWAGDGADSTTHPQQCMAMCLLYMAAVWVPQAAHDSCGPPGC